MYHNKKIAVFVSHIYGDYQNKLCQGISSQSAKLGYPVEFYTTNDGENLGSYDLGEESVLKIPSLEDIAGFIFASGTYRDKSLRDKICSFLTESKLPVIEVTEEAPLFPYVTMDNNASAGELTAHMINVHGAKRVCYLGHKNDPFHSGLREKAFKESMAESGLAISENDIALCDETVDSYEEALNIFTASGKPDAIIAYNDIVALGFMDCARNRGYNIPEDFAVTGCDNTDGGKYVSPRLTTVDFPLNEVGEKAVDNLMLLLSGTDFKGEIVKASPIYRRSCGCLLDQSPDYFKYLRNRSKKIIALETSMISSMKLSTALSHAEDLDKGCEIMADFVKEIPDVKELYLCLYPDWNAISSSVLSLEKNLEIKSFEEDSEQDDDESYDDSSIILKLGVKNGKQIPECSFSKTSLLPPFVSADDNKAFIVAPLFFESKAFGYLAMSLYNGNIAYPFHIVQWITNIAQFLHSTCEAEYTNKLSERLEEIYLRDNLTKLYNRHGFDKLFLKSGKDSVYTTLAFFDLDHLKDINDTYGHEEGDFALKAVGQAILKASGEKDITARFGGDEFYCILFHDDEEYAKEFVDAVTKFLANYSKLSEKPYSISASCGYETVKTNTLTEVSELFKAADEKMYIAKRNRNK